MAIKSCNIGIAIFVLSVSLVYLTSIAGPNPKQADIANIIAPIAIIISCAMICIRNILEYRFGLLLPYTWFYLACSLYYGFGPLAFYFARQETIDYINQGSRYPIGVDGLLETNILNTAGILIVSASIIFFEKFVFRTRYTRVHHTLTFNKKKAEQVLWFFILIGGTIKYAFALPRFVGLTKFALPGIVEHLYLMLTASIVVCVLLVRSGSKQYVWVLAVILTTEIITSVMTLSKAAIIFTLLAYLLGIFISRPSLKLLSAYFIGIMALYVLVLSPFVAFAREGMVGIGFYDLVDRLSLFFGRLDENQYSTYETEVIQNWWARLVYANYQKFAIDMYGAGQSGDSLQQVYYALVPRVLFPDKPIMSYGAEFSNLLEAGMGEWTLTALGMFAEGYWNAGTAGLFGVCFWAGFVLSGFAKFSDRSMHRGRVGMILASLASIQVGLGPDLWFAGTYVGGAGEGAFFATILWFLFYRNSSSSRRRAEVL